MKAFQFVISALVAVSVASTPCFAKTTPCERAQKKVESAIAAKDRAIARLERKVARFRAKNTESAARTVERTLGQIETAKENHDNKIAKAQAKADRKCGGKSSENFATTLNVPVTTQTVAGGTTRVTLEASTGNRNSNGRNPLVVYPGEQVNISWGVQNADQVVSYFAANQTGANSVASFDGCGRAGQGDWVANRVSSFENVPLSIIDCQLGYDYTYTVNALKNGIIQASGKVTIRVASNPAVVTSFLEARSGNRSSTQNNNVLIAFPYEPVTYSWGTTNADRVESEWRVSGGSDNCGWGWVGNWIASSPVSFDTKSVAVEECQRQTDYEITLRAYRNNTLQSVSQITVRVFGN